jgi:outer membrane biosynthesis protein TonB
MLAGEHSLIVCLLWLLCDLLLKRFCSSFSKHMHGCRSYYLVGIADTCLMWPTSTVNVFMFVGNCFYSFEGVSAMVPLTAAMENRDRCIPIMHKALMVIITIQIIIAVSCYVSFQDINSGSITAVLASNRRIDISPFALLMMNMLVVTAVVFTFPIPFFPAIQLLEKWIGLTKSTHHDEEAPPPQPLKKGREEEEEELKPRKSKKKHKKEKKHKKAKKEKKSSKTVDGQVFNPLRREDYSDEEEEEEEEEVVELIEDKVEDAEPLQLVPSVEENVYCLPCKQILFRTFVVFCIGAVVEAVPDLALIIDLFGSVFGSALSIIIPCYLSLKSEQFDDPVSHISHTYFKSNHSLFNNTAYLIWSNSGE